jgi:hypothetical protein
MTVKQLIEKLSKMSGDLKIITYTDKYCTAVLANDAEVGEYDSNSGHFEPLKNCLEDMEPNAVRIG